MQKILTVFERGDDHKVNCDFSIGCEWVAAGEGIATEKLDGTNVRLTVRAGMIVRVEKRRNPSKAQKLEGIRDGWYVDAVVDDPQDKWINAAACNTGTKMFPDGEHSCEAIGPKIQGNPLGLDGHLCVPFNLLAPVYVNAPRTFQGLKAYLLELDSRFSPGHLAEGIVFHHPDGRRAKIKRKDFDYGTG